MKNLKFSLTPLLLSFYFLFFLGNCKSVIQQQGKTYQKTKDIESLKQVVDLLPNDADTTFLKELLGEPIDMGFDYRYLTELTGENGCVIGAVFHLDEMGKVDDKWVGEICE